MEWLLGSLLVVPAAGAVLCRLLPQRLKLQHVVSTDISIELRALRREASYPSSLEHSVTSPDKMDRSKIPLKSMVAGVAQQRASAASERHRRQSFVVEEGGKRRPERKHWPAKHHDKPSK